MTIEITRQPSQEKETLGVLRVHGSSGVMFECKTLELPWKNNERRVSCIPAGLYLVAKTHTAHLGDHFWIMNVKGRDGIKIHSANYFSQLLGCIALGDSFGDRNGDGVLDVLNSKATLKKLYDMMPDKFALTIK